MMRKLAIVWLSMMISLTGCMGDSIIDDPEKVKKMGEIGSKKIVIWHTYSDEETSVFENEIIPAFEAAYPDIRIESIRQTHNQEYLSALMARVAAGKSPDIIRMDYSWIPLFASRGLLQPLEGYESFEEHASRLRGPMLDSNRFDGHVYGLPLNMAAKAAIYNRKLLEKAGLQTPPSSMAEVIELAQSNGYVIGMGGIGLWHSLPYFTALGGQLADERFTRTNGYLNSDASVEAVRTLLNLYKQGIIYPNMFVGNGDLWNNIYKSDHLLMIDEGPWYHSIMMNSSSLDSDLLAETWTAPFPTDGPYGSIIGGESLVMTKGAQFKAEAWTFMMWMTRKETQQRLFTANLIPVNMDALEAETKALGEHPDRQYLMPFITGIQKAFYRPPLAEWNEIEVIYNDTLEDIFVRDKDIEEALDQAVLQIDALLDPTSE
ncbi:extracellular solute-binding protein [Cohnella algarum]|uniref:extracellular solute-binding protein n=1 Tax=Cohnella algarum TaxID=2044859 RepID=UPI001968524B|nr:extracellular solute-binding protein [Cohnella algarum]MBN2982323.1 extracellular solute-binding protein [Cohnella algarum]